MIDNVGYANVFRSGGLALQGFLTGLLLAAISTLSIRISQFEAPLTFVPFIAIFFWPRNASRGLSSLFIFIIGLVVDILSGGPLGLWPLVYLASYGAIRLDGRTQSPDLRSQWGQFSVWILVILLVIYLLGAVFVEGRTAFKPLIMQAAAAIFLFPVFYWIWRAVNSLVRERNNSGVIL